MYRIQKDEDQTSSLALLSLNLNCRQKKYLDSKISGTDRLFCLVIPVYCLHLRKKCAFIRTEEPHIQSAGTVSCLRSSKFKSLTAKRIKFKPTGKLKY